MHIAKTEKVLVIFCPAVQFTDIFFYPKTRNSKEGENTCEKSLRKIPSYYINRLGPILLAFLS